MNGAVNYDVDEFKAVTLSTDADFSTSWNLATHQVLSTVCYENL